jgi:hypothetical protein
MPTDIYLRSEPDQTARRISETPKHGTEACFPALAFPGAKRSSRCWTRKSLLPKGAGRLPRRLKQHESVFEINLEKILINERGHLRGMRSRYSLWKNFLSSAIADDAPIYTVV